MKSSFDYMLLFLLLANWQIIGNAPKCGGGCQGTGKANSLFSKTEKYN